MEGIQCSAHSVVSYRTFPDKIVGSRTAQNVRAPFDPTSGPLYRTTSIPASYAEMLGQIPKTQVAVVLADFGKPVVVQRDFPVTQPSELQPGQCLVKMICTGVCHTDLHVSKADWPVKAMKLPLVGGHEGIGEVVSIANHTSGSPIKLGQRVGIKWVAYCCRDCEPCRKGLDQKCANAQISGFTVDGTFCQYVVSWVNDVTPIPDSIQDSFAAASLLCAGVTAYRALKHSDARIGNWVVITGAGGGLGHLAVQYAVAMGMRVVAIDAGEDKRRLCLELGAEKWIDFKSTANLVEAVVEACDGLGPHAAIVTSPNGQGYTQAVDYLQPGGTLMAVGVPANATLDASIFWTVGKNISIKGSYFGNRQESIEAISIAASGKVKVKYTVKGLTELQQVYTDLEEGKVAGRVVLDALNVN